MGLIRLTSGYVRNDIDSAKRTAKVGQEFRRHRTLVWLVQASFSWKTSPTSAWQRLLYARLERGLSLALQSIEIGLSSPEVYEGC